MLRSSSGRGGTRRGRWSFRVFLLCWLGPNQLLADSHKLKTNCPIAKCPTKCLAFLISHVSNIWVKCNAYPIYYYLGYIFIILDIFHLYILLIYPSNSEYISGWDLKIFLPSGEVVGARWRVNVTKWRDISLQSKHVETLSRPLIGQSLWTLGHDWLRLITWTGCWAQIGWEGRRRRHGNMGVRHWASPDNGDIIRAASCVPSSWSHKPYPHDFLISVYISPLGSGCLLTYLFRWFLCDSEEAAALKLKIEQCVEGECFYFTSPGWFDL